MTEIERISDQQRRAFDKEAWCGSSLREALADVTPEKAAARPLANAHSIWEIVLHVAAWKGAVRRRIEGERVTVPDEGDYPPVLDTTEEAWGKALGVLEGNHRVLVNAVSQLPDSRLEEPIAEGMASLYVTLHGSAQHDLYHAAQIAILKKA